MDDRQGEGSKAPDADQAVKLNYLDKAFACLQRLEHSIGQRQRLVSLLSVVLVALSLDLLPHNTIQLTPFNVETSPPHFPLGVGGLVVAATASIVWINSVVALRRLFEIVDGYHSLNLLDGWCPPEGKRDRSAPEGKRDRAPWGKLDPSGSLHLSLLARAVQPMRERDGKLDRRAATPLFVNWVAVPVATQVLVLIKLTQVADWPEAVTVFLLGLALMSSTVVWCYCALSKEVRRAWP
jgi:hypothetical protein